MRRIGIAAALLCSVALPALAGDVLWDDLKSELYGEQFMLDGTGVIAIDAPFRTPDDARTDLAAQIVAPEGTQLVKVTVVLDENPMPVSAVFDMQTPQSGFYFDITMRVNGPTPLHVIAEMTDGRLFVSETFVKTSGTGACSAPPGTDPELALATLGDMRIETVGSLPGVGEGAFDSLAARLGRVDINVSHPSHSGMQRDQISLLYVPMRYVDTLAVDLDGADFVNLTGSISLSENPRLGLAVPHGTSSVDVTLTDTSGTVTHTRQDLPGL